jgi:predicted nucleic acid-binding protein
MSSLHLHSYKSVCWRPGKAGYVDVVAALSPTETTQPSPALDSIAAPLALACVKKPKQALALWLSWKGYRNFHKAPKAFHNVLHVCAEDSHLGIFYTQHRGEDLAFALIEHAQGNVERLVGAPRTYATELAALMHDVVPEGERKNRPKSSPSGSCFAVRQAALRRTTRGYVVAAVVSTDCGAHYGVVGDLAANVWRKWQMRCSDSGGDAAPCIFIPSSGADARFVRCDIEAPIDCDAAVVAPSIPLALSAFERVFATDADGAAAVTSSSSAASRVECAVLRECVLPTRLSASVTERCYQSRGFLQPTGDGGTSTPARCLTVVEDPAVLMYTVIVPGQRVSYVVHVSYTAGGSEVVASAVAVADLSHPISVCTLRVAASPQRPAGTTLTLMLCRDMKLYTCEHFGQSASVVLRINNLRSSVVTFPFPPLLRPSRRQQLQLAQDAASDCTRLITVQDGTEIICTNGVIGVFFRVSAATLQTAPPTVTRATVGDAAARFAADANGVGATALQRCLARLEELSLRTTRHELPDIVFREVLPLLRYVGTSQQEAMLVQRVYERLLHMAGPNLQSEWNYLWALTTAVQRTLAKRNKENGVLYTDAFFLQLADTYRRSEFASTEGTAVVADAVRASVSDEVAQVITAQPTLLSPEVQYVLDGLAEGVSPIDLAEEVARRMVHTSTLSNGATVVSTHPGKAECVHGMGCVLLASCLDLTVYAYAQEGRAMRMCVQPPSQQPRSNGDGQRASTDAACVAVRPYSFQTQANFAKALTLAGDLLCVSTADASFRPDVALLALAIGTRQHCLAAFVQLFALVLRSAVEEVSPLANNAAWLQASAATLSRSFEEHTAALLCEERSTGMSLSTTLSYVLYTPQQSFNTAFFHALSSTLTEEFCTGALVACVFHQTERLVAATQNYAAAVATYTISRSESEREGAWQAVQVGSRRLRSVLSQTYALWAHMGTLSPYQVQDVAASYLMSAHNSMASSSTQSTAGGEEKGTVVSRTLVACFRLLCLVQFCCDTEDAMPLQPAAEKVSNDDDVAGRRRMEDCARAMQALYLLREAPLPLEWYQRRFVALIQSTAAEKPTWGPFLLRLVQLSNVHQTDSAGLKKGFFKVLDMLQNSSTQSTSAGITDALRDEMRRATAAAESAVTALTLLEEAPDLQQGNTARLRRPPTSTQPASAAPTVCYMFSPARDASLPRWTNLHTLPERHYLFSHDWMDVLWTVERMPVALRVVAERVVRCIAEVPVPASGEQEAALSVEMANPLFAHLCRLRPPVRVHAALTHSTEPDTAVSTPSAVQRRREQVEAVAPPATVADVPEPQPGGVATPEKLAAPQEALQVSLPPKAQTAVFHTAAVASAAVLQVPHESERADVPPSRTADATNERKPSAPVPITPPVRPISPAMPLHQATVAPAPAHGSASAPGLPREDEKDNNAHTGMYAPADVAWWDSIGLPTTTTTTITTAAAAKTSTTPSPPPAKEAPKMAAEAWDASAAVNTATGDENGESSDTATSYTTSTSKYADPIATLDEFGRQYGRHREQEMRALSSSGSRSNSSSCGDRHGFSVEKASTLYGERRHVFLPRSPPLQRSRSTKKKCHCCHRAIHRRHDHRSHVDDSRVGRHGGLFSEDALSLRWKDGALETVVSPLRPLPTVSAATARPTLLSFATRLQPPEEPQRSYAQTARTPSHYLRSDGCDVADTGGAGVPHQIALLRLPSSPSAAPEASRVHLYTLRGERVESASGGGVVPLRCAEVPTRGVLMGRAAPLTVPPVPPSSVFVVPPTLLQLPSHHQQQQQQPQGRASHGSGGVLPLSPRHPDTAAREAVATESHPYPQVARAPISPAPPFLDLATMHNLSAAVAQVQSPQSQFTTEAPAPMTPAVPVGMTQAIPDLSPVTPAAVLNPSQMDDFHRYTNDLLARHSAPATAQTAATPPAAAAAQVDGTASPVNVTTTGAPPADCPGVARLVQQQEDFIRKAEALLQTRQAENEGFYRRVVESIRTLTAASQHLRGLTPVEQSQLVRNTVKQRNELINLNHQLLEMQLAAARVGGGEIPLPAASSPQAAAAMPLGALTSAATLGASETSQTVPLPAVSAAPGAARMSVGVSWTTPPPPAPSLTSVLTQTPTLQRVGMQEALSDLQRLNTELMGVNASAEAMDKAIKETREVIQRYERSKTAEALAAEGAALTSAMRLRTAAIEQRLSELPRAFTQPMDKTAAWAAPHAPPHWTVHSSPLMEAEEGEARPANAPRTLPSGGPRSTFTAVSQVAEIPAALASPPQLTLHAVTTPSEVGWGAGTEAAVQSQNTPRQHSNVPVARLTPDAATDVNTVPPSRCGAASVVDGGPASPAFTSVLSTPLDGADVVAATMPSPTPSPAPFTAHRVADIRSPSVSFLQPQLPRGGAAPFYSHQTEGRQPCDFDEGGKLQPPARSSTTARVCTKLCDLRTLFTEAGGGLGHAGPHTPFQATQRASGNAACTPVRRPPSLLPRQSAVTQRSKSITTAAGTSRGSTGDRFAMYRVPSKQPKRPAGAAAGLSSCLPVSYTHSNDDTDTAPNAATVGISNSSVPAPPRRHSVGDAYADRQRDRRMMSIARRMQQLEHDLFD